MSEKTWVTEPEEYVSTLSPSTLEMAEAELREDPFSRKQALTSLREWIKQNPKIVNCRLDSGFLLRFLRFKKFSLLQTQEALERYLLLRQTFGIAFNHFDIRIPMMEELTDLGYLFPCPQRDSKGRRVIIARPGVFDLYKFTNADMCRIHGIVYETLMEDEENQVRGYVHFADGQGKTLPMRHKEVHVINAHPSMKFASKEDMLKSNIIERHILPKEYGGEMPMAEMIALWKEEIKAKQPVVLSHDKMEVREELFTRQARIGAVSALKNKNAINCGSEDDNIFGITGNFRKLEVD
ncbi:alpha-tocopherol transfer protein-related [Holotrichia oblita]|uniref:Alpha-tocopherol transfer protein-related n=1 Tax=Holotrichia oblita TaxID=644536 RepID=A0ACB9TSK3_HOLOL|nr:alpha-tocopherol transfer protein-related [Holotrichia oblita]